MTSKRFSIAIRRWDNYLIKVESGYATREDAERIAERRREEIKNRGWTHYVYVEEAHEVIEP